MTMPWNRNRRSLFNSVCHGPMAIPIAMAVVQTVGTIQQGRAADKQSKFQAAQLLQNAGQARATSQVRAIDERRKAQLIGSKAMANAAASGAGTDGTAAKIMGDIAGEGEYRALSRLFDGEQSARGMETQAAAARMEGKAARQSSYFKAATTMGSAIGGSFQSKYASDLATENAINKDLDNSVFKKGSGLY